MVFQRSADAFLGVPFNIASYALLTHMIAKQSCLDVDNLIWSGGDCHIYNSHYFQVLEQLSRTPLPLPSLFIKPKIDSIFDYKYNDFVFLDYQHYPAIKAQVAV